jgi:hypothetical protein
MLFAQARALGRYRHSLRTRQGPRRSDDAAQKALSLALEDHANALRRSGWDGTVEKIRMRRARREVNDPESRPVSAAKADLELDLGRRAASALRKSPTGGWSLMKLAVNPMTHEVQKAPRFAYVPPKSRCGAQVVTMNADLLQFQLTPPAAERRTGGADLTGVNVDTKANVTNATIRKVRFIGILRVWLQCATNPQLGSPVVIKPPFQPDFAGRTKRLRPREKWFHGRLLDEARL